MANTESKKRKSTASHAEQKSKSLKETSKPSAVFTPTKPRHHTVSIALPGSIIANALTHDQKTALAGHIARACAVFCVDEVIIFDDGQAETRPPEKDGYTAFTDPNFFLYHLLSYLETPPHLRKKLFPMHPDLRTAGSLPSLDMPHHLRSDEYCPYREGVVVRTGARGSNAPGVLVDCGLPQPVFAPVEVDLNTRVTIKLDPASGEEGEAVSPDAPREDAGYYWGYAIRQASSLSNVFTECPYDGGYDMSIGTSERGCDVRELLDSASESAVASTWAHLLVVFGGVAGLEPALEADEELLRAGVDQVEMVFDHWVNLMPGQGSRTIRTEEAVWIGLTELRQVVVARLAA